MNLALRDIRHKLGRFLLTCAGLGLLLGVVAVLITPREEEPQIDVTMANVIVPFPGAAVRDVEQMIATPAEQVLAQMLGVEHVMSVSRPGMAVLTVQFAVGVPRTEALVRLHDTLRSNADWLPRGLGAQEPIVRPKGIDDVPVVTLTLFSDDPDSGPFALERVAHSIEAELMRVPGARTVTTLGGQRKELVHQHLHRFAGDQPVAAGGHHHRVEHHMGKAVGADGLRHHAHHLG